MTKNHTLILVSVLLTGCLSATTKSLTSQPAVPMPPGTDPVAWRKASDSDRINQWVNFDKRNKLNGMYIGMRLTPEMRERAQQDVSRAMRAEKGTQFQQLQARRSRQAAPGQWEICGKVNPRLGGKLTGWKPFFYRFAPDTSHHGVQIDALAQQACQGEFVPVGQ